MGEKPIFLVGYMCSGKTTLGKELARQMGVDFVDLDELIETQQKCSVSEIFASRGETGFRKIETETLQALIKDLHDKTAIIALGGGTPCQPGVMELLNSVGKVIYLEVPVPRLVERLIIGGDKRPLVAGKTAEELKDYVEKMIEQRKKFYEKAQHRFDASKLETAEEVQHSAKRFQEIICN